MQPKDTDTTTEPIDDLVLEQLPNGQHAWLKPERARRYILPRRYWLTDKGRAAIHADDEASS